MQQICTCCGYTGNDVSRKKGSGWIEFILWIGTLFTSGALVVFALPYSVWRMISRSKVCPKCQKDTMIPVNSPMGQELINKFHTRSQIQNSAVFSNSSWANSSGNRHYGCFTYVLYSIVALLAFSFISNKFLPEEENANVAKVKNQPQVNQVLSSAPVSLPILSIPPDWKTGGSIADLVACKSWSVIFKSPQQDTEWIMLTKPECRTGDSHIYTDMNMRAMARKSEKTKEVKFLDKTECHFSYAQRNNELKNWSVINFVYGDKNNIGIMCAGSKKEIEKFCEKITLEIAKQEKLF